MPQACVTSMVMVAGVRTWRGSVLASPTRLVLTQRTRATWLFAWAAGGAVALVPLWSHLTLIGSRLHGFIAVFDEVAVYPSDVCLAVVALAAIVRPVRLDAASRLLALGLTLLAAVALLSARSSSKPVLACGVAGQLALLTLAWLGLRSARVPRAVVLGALVGASVVESGLAAAQFGFQQPLVSSELPLPWLPSDPAAGGAPVILSTSGDRLLRGFGTFPHPNLLGGYLALALVCVPLVQEHSPRKALLRWALAGAISVGLLATFSRAGWLAAGVGLGVSWGTAVRNRHRRWWLPPLIGVVALTALAFSPVGPTIGERFSALGPDPNPLERGSIENRLALDQSAFAEIRDHLPQGVGAGNYGLGAIAGRYQEGWGEPAPNLVLLIAAELGLPGLVALVLVVAGVVRTLRATRIAAPVVGAWFALFVLGMFDHYLWTMPLGRAIASIPLALLATSPAR